MCLPDLCVNVDCDDGNPCTEDTCDPQRENVVARISTANSSALLEAQCGEGRCIAGQCLSFDGRSCTASVAPKVPCLWRVPGSGRWRLSSRGPRGPCSDMDVPGHCSATGECVRTSATKPVRWCPMQRPMSSMHYRRDYTADILLGVLNPHKVPSDRCYNFRNYRYSHPSCFWWRHMRKFQCRCGA